MQNIHQTNPVIPVIRSPRPQALALHEPQMTYLSRNSGKKSYHKDGWQNKDKESKIIMRQDICITGGKQGLGKKKRKLNQKVERKNEALVWRRKIILHAPITQMHCWRPVLKYKFSTEAIRLEVTCTGREPSALAVGSHSAPRAPATESKLYLSDTEPLNTVISQLRTLTLALKFSSF